MNSNSVNRRMREKSRSLSVTSTHPASRHDKASRTSLANAFETEKMQALTEDSVAQAIGTWIGRAENRAMLERRKKMQQIFDKLIAEEGEEVKIQD
jgi:hypothetical protein